MSQDASIQSKHEEIDTDALNAEIACTVVREQELRDAVDDEIVADLEGRSNE